MAYWLAAVSAEISGVIVSSMSSREYAAIPVHWENLSSGTAWGMANHWNTTLPTTEIVAKMIVY